MCTTTCNARTLAFPQTYRSRGSIFATGGRSTMSWLTGYVHLIVMHYDDQTYIHNNPLIIGKTLRGMSTHQKEIWSSFTCPSSDPCVRYCWHRSDNFAPNQEWQSVLHHRHGLFFQVGVGSPNANEGGKACSRIPLQDDTAPWLPSGECFRPVPRVLPLAGRSPWRANRLQAQDYRCLSPPVQWPWWTFLMLEAQLQKLVNKNQDNWDEQHPFWV